MSSSMIKQTAQAMVLGVISNALAQTITAYQESKPITLETYSLRPIVDFALFALLNTPINILWQEWLESTFPGTTQPQLSEQEKHAVGDSYAHLRELEKKNPPPPTRDATDPAQTTGEGGARMDGERAASAGTMNVRNTLTKLALDQTVGAALNTVLFFAGMGAIRGQGWDAIVAAIRQDALGLWLDGLKVWGPVSVICFTVLPVQHRVLFASLVGVGWGVYLSLVAG